MNTSFYKYNCSIGKNRRLNRIFHLNKCVLVPLDDSMIFGPEDGLFHIGEKIRKIEEAGPSAFVGFSGTASLCKDFSIPFILNLTASTNKGQHNNKVLISTVRKAIEIGADAVAVHINVSSCYESSMLSNMLKVSEDCHKYGMPLMIMIYPRCESYNGSEYVDNNYDTIKNSDVFEYSKLVSHCVRIAFELGADIIKTQYTGSIDSFSNVINSAAGTPVLIAGGKQTEPNILFENICGAMSAGATGVCIGRNVFNDSNPNLMLQAIKSIVFNGISSENALEIYCDK